MSGIVPIEHILFSFYRSYYKDNNDYIKLLFGCFDIKYGTFPALLAHQLNFMWTEFALSLFLFGTLFVCMHVRMHVCMHECMHVLRFNSEWKSGLY